MDKSFSSILEDVIKYEKKELMLITISVSVLLLILFAIAIIKYKSFTFPNKVIFTLIICIFCVAILLYVINWNVFQNKLNVDIANQQYISYIGEFTHDNYQKDSYYHNVYLIVADGRKLLVRYPDYGNHYNLYSDNKQLPVGTFNGKIIYSQNSKIIVSFDICP